MCLVNKIVITEKNNSTKSLHSSHDGIFNGLCEYWIGYANLIVTYTLKNILWKS